MTASCEECGGDFEKQKRGRFCSSTCRNRANWKRKREGYPSRPCPRCGGPLAPGQVEQCSAPACREAQRQDRRKRHAERQRELWNSNPGWRVGRLEWRARWREVNRELVRQQDRQFYAANRRMRIARAVEQRARRLQAPTVSFTTDQLRQRLAMYAGCWICGDPRWTEADHVKPLAKGGPHMLANLRPACTTCNRRKGATWPFAPSLGKAA